MAARNKDMPVAVELWADLDSGAGVWENVPTAVRAAFRALLQNVDTINRQHLQSSAVADDARRQLSDRMQQVEGAVERISADVNANSDTLRSVQGCVASALLPCLPQPQPPGAAYPQHTSQQHLAATATLTLAAVPRLPSSPPCSAVAERPTSEAVRGALSRKADREDVAAAARHAADTDATVAELRATVASLSARNDALALELATFKQEAKDGVITATRAANEARSAVSTALAAVALTEPPASAAAVAAVEAEAARLRAEVVDVRAGLAQKADIEAVNEALDAKANKVTVAAALHKKVGTTDSRF